MFLTNFILVALLYQTVTLRTTTLGNPSQTKPLFNPTPKNNIILGVLLFFALEDELATF